MTSVSRPRSAEPTTDSTEPIAGTDSVVVNRRKLYRFAGWGALLSGACYLLQPILVFVLEATSSATEDLFPSPAQLEDTFWQGPLEAAIFSGVGGSGPGRRDQNGRAGPGAVGSRR
ncbi:hypothetical protein [Micromonospora sp. NBC_01638]|uniref:hypothetical protein n=1 Tax=Micromonospora sp. NBC_01638 TaxID=2975982 RepID=UPI003866DBBB|nr:hypothetical protein OG811_32100 [Micromonospora sp. NBC_01638]